MQVEARHLSEELGMDALSGYLDPPPPRIDGEASSPLAIHVYSTLAKLHKHSLIPYLPRIMSCVLSSLSSSLQLHPACMQVVSTLAIHTIDSSRDPASNEETLRSLCRPLLSALLIPDPLHLSSGAASCLQSLVESDRWKCAPLDLQELVCAKGMQGLVDESIQTVAHMDLMRSLASISSGVVIQGYGAPLLAAGMDILQNSSSTMKRVAAAQLLESILKIADAELLDLDLSPIVGVLQECQQDEVAGVRTAAADALKTANSYASYANPCDKICASTVTGKSMQQSFCRLAHNAHMKSPALARRDGGLPLNGTPCHGPLVASTPSLHKSDRWLRRLPLGPLQQSSLANSTSDVPTRKRHVASRLSEYKENVAPANNIRVPASRDVQQSKTWMPKKDSPLLWPQISSRTTQVENWSLFDSPHTPIVPFRGEREFGERDSSVTTLLEKHFGKQKYLFEDEMDVSLGYNTSNVASFVKKEICDQEEEHCNDGEVCNSFDQDFGGSSRVDSSGTDLCCGTEGIYSPDKESASDCESSIASDHGSNMQNLSLNGDLMMTPQRLVRTLQFDYEYEINLDQENQILSESSDVGTPDDARCLVGASCQSEEGSCYADSKISRISTESNSGSESCALFSEGDTQVNLNSADSSSMVKRRVRHHASSILQKVRLSELMYSGACFEEDKSKQHQNHALSRHSSTCDDYEKVKGHLSSHHDAGGQGNMPDVELKISMLSQQKKQSNLCSGLWGKVRYVFVFVISVGLFVAGFTTYVEHLEGSNVLVPT
ncbi:hypothetical protein GOP47_0017129 [Adiantum capillus-veneris]|uniref:TORTIFOLIA1/SINE1-2 N-terminal domain-containing protein n=1 Tax=Adiantum capillus-veneris TaxID=13818 RepID=A0A9D4ZBB8_ADICA|nr:hypothetical protein GOP47_0017129 [Adiantum capillus-veneris]